MKTKDLSTVRVLVDDFLYAKGYAPKCISRYHNTWDHVAKFMEDRGIATYSSCVGRDFLNWWHDGRDYKSLTDREKERVRHVSVLTDIVEYGHVRRCVHYAKVYVFDGELGVPFWAFIADMAQSRSPSTIRRYEERINVMFQFLKSEYKSIADFDVPMAILLLKRLDTDKPIVDRNNTIMTLRVFIRYLCSKSYIPDNRPEMWMSLFKLKYIRSAKIPSVYTEDEVDAVLKAIDRAHPQGKRDYAMTMLAARCGLRISDIIGLRFCNLRWESNRIELVQQKTGRKVSLPLSEDVGSALIDYISHGRPDVSLPYVFITAHAPYKELSSNILAQSVGDWMRYAGIDSSKRKHGPHALRHSLATNLLGANSTMPVISEILGHATTESTAVYTKVNTSQLRQCALDVPLVPSSFYENIYGKH